MMNIWVLKPGISTNLENWSKYVPSGYVKIAIEAMAIEIVDFPMKNWYVPQLCKRLPEGIYKIGLVLWFFHPVFHFSSVG